MRRSVIFLVALLAAGSAAAQAARQWRTGHGLPVAVIQMPGGDLQHFAGIVPANALVPASLAGFKAEIQVRPGAQVWTVSVPAVLAVAVALEVTAALESSGGAAVVSLGPAPIRELEPALAGLDGVHLTPVTAPRCALTEGAVAVVQGEQERLELILPAPSLADASVNLAPVVADLVRRRLAGRWPAVDVNVEIRDFCPRMVIRLPSPELRPRELLAPLRQALAAIASSEPTESEVALVENVASRVLTSWSVDGRSAAIRIAERLAAGGSAATALSPPALDPPSLGRLVRELIDGHPGMVVIVENEHRSLPTPPLVLDNGIVVHCSWMPTETAVMAMAFAGLAPEAASALTGRMATAAAEAGWHVDVRTTAGVPAIAVACPASELVLVLERMADFVAAGTDSRAQGFDAMVATTLGLETSPAAESIALALALPPDLDEAQDAIEKFYGDLPRATVVSGAPLPREGLTWSVAGGTPAVAAVVELPSSDEGWIAGQLLIERVRAVAGTQARWLDLPGRLALEIVARGAGHVPGLDAQLGASWAGLRRRVTAEEVGGAARALVASLYGDLARSTLRSAAATFLPEVPRMESLLAVEDAAVSATLAGLPLWENLLRIGYGPAPLVVVPPASVQQSRPRRPGR